MKSTLLILGQTLENLYSAVLANGFSNESEYYYDAYFDNKVS